MDDGSVRLHPELCRRVALLGSVDATAQAEAFAQLLLIAYRETAALGTANDLTEVVRNTRNRA
jgi:hypothetical protein